MLSVGAGECGECLADGYYANAGELEGKGTAMRERASDGRDGWCGWWI